VTSHAMPARRVVEDDVRTAGASLAPRLLPSRWRSRGRCSPGFGSGRLVGATPPNPCPGARMNNAHRLARTAPHGRALMARRAGERGLDRGPGSRGLRGQRAPAHTGDWCGTCLLIATTAWCFHTAPAGSGLCEPAGIGVLARGRSPPAWGGGCTVSTRGGLPGAGRDEQPRAEQAPRPREGDHPPHRPGLPSAQAPTSAEPAMPPP
jgi:hypothetical protein